MIHHHKQDTAELLSLPLLQLMRSARKSKGTIIQRHEGLCVINVSGQMKLCQQDLSSFETVDEALNQDRDSQTCLSRVPFRKTLM